MKREVNDTKGLENYQYYEVGVDDNPFDGGDHFYVSTYKNEEAVENNESTEVEFDNISDFVDFTFGKEDITE